MGKKKPSTQSKSPATNSFFASLARHTLFFWLTTFFIFIGAFFRLYNLENSQQFLSDQGRDSLVVSKIWRDHDPVFIGPVTSIGNMYLGPLYYYFMLPFLWLSYPSPMGPIYAVAVLGVITLWVFSHLGKELVGQKAATIGLAFYALSAVVITYTRFSWNPNPAPLVSLIMMWCVYRAWHRQPWYWTGVAVCFSILIQLHYLALLSAGGAGVMWLLHGWQLYRQRSKPFAFQTLKVFWLATVISLGVVVTSLVPLILFDYKHSGVNIKGFTELFTEEDSFKVSPAQSPLVSMGQTLLETHGRSLHILFEISVGKFRAANTILSLLVLGWLLKQLWPQLKSLLKDPLAKPTGLSIITAFLFTGIMGTALYQHTIFDHYIAYLFPVTYLIYGALGSWLIDRYQRWGVGLVVGAWIIFVLLNLPQIPIASAGWTINDMAKTSTQILELVADDEPYNIVLLTDTKDTNAINYRFFLNSTNHPPLPNEESQHAKTIIIINEQHRANPIDTSIFELAIFPYKKPVERIKIPSGPELVVLRRAE